EREREREVALYKLIQYVWGYVTVKLETVCEFNRGTTITARDIKSGNVPVVSGGQKPAYYHNVSNRSANCITVAGSGAYAGYVSFWKEPIFCCDSFTVDVKNKEILDIKYLYYYLLNNQKKIYAKKKGAGIPHVHGKDISNFIICIPEYKKQTDIVSTLDKLDTLCNDLTSGLPAEIDARKKQYEYYRDKLLTFK
ncbi:MAG: restriction endonuclease subunit S, partial [Lachnospiraceae bacterium]|nr:restriction endonuclease subunit S [Lachnospiraceae bacterium]